MADLDFPIVDPQWRWPLLIMEWILSFALFELGITFVARFRNKGSRQKSVQDIGFAAFFFGGSAMWYFFVLSDYFSPDEIVLPFLIWPAGSTRMFILNLSYYSLLVGVLLFIYFTERHVKFRVKYVFTIITLLMSVFYTWLFFIDMFTTKTTSAIYYPLFLIFLVFLFFDLAKRLGTNRTVSLRLFFTYLIPFFAFIIGFVLGLDISVIALGFISRFIGAIVQLGAFVAMSLLFFKLPPLSTLSWRNYVEQVFLIDKAGMCLFQKAYSEQSSAMDDNLKTSAISTVNSILEEMIAAGESGLSFIEKEDKVFTTFSSKNVNGVIVSKIRNESIGYNLKNLVETFEAIYQRFIVEWDGDAEIFKPVEAMVDRIFSK